MQEVEQRMEQLPSPTSQPEACSNTAGAIADHDWIYSNPFSNP
jgi:hypothetical protein